MDGSEGGEKLRRLRWFSPPSDSNSDEREIYFSNYKHLTLHKQYLIISHHFPKRNRKMNIYTRFMNIFASKSNKWK